MSAVYTFSCIFLIFWESHFWKHRFYAFNEPILRVDLRTRLIRKLCSLQSFSLRKAFLKTPSSKDTLWFWESQYFRKKAAFRELHCKGDFRGSHNFFVFCPGAKDPFLLRKVIWMADFWTLSTAKSGSLV